MAIARARAAEIPERGLANSADDSAPAAAASPSGPSLWVVAGSILLVTVGAIVAWRLNDCWDPKAAKLPEGISIFALFYVLAQALERGLEPITKFIGAATKANEKKDERDNATVALIRKATEDNAQRAAQAQAAVSSLRANLAIGLWALASVIAMLLSAATGAYFLRTLGIRGVGDKRWLDIVITGLAIGAGTKPLHDLITRIEKAKEKAEDPPETGGQ